MLLRILISPFKRGIFIFQPTAHLRLLYGAIVTTISHDFRNIIAAGTSDKDVLVAVRHVIQSMMEWLQRSNKKGFLTSAHFHKWKVEAERS